MRAEMLEAAFALIVERGYDKLTADDLAKGIGVSRATFFRYLGSKDEVVVQGTLGSSAQFADAYRAADHAPGASQWSRLRAAFEPAAQLAEESPDVQRKRLQMIQSQPALGAQLRRARAPQIEDLAEALIDSGCDIFDAHVLATASIAVLDQCWMQWVRNSDLTLREVLDHAFAALESGAMRG